MAAVIAGLEPQIKKGPGPVFPDAVQALFDAAKDVERGKKGRCLKDHVPIDLEGALKRYAVAFEALDAAAPVVASEAWLRVRASYVARVERIRSALEATCSAATFHELYVGAARAGIHGP